MSGNRIANQVFAFLQFRERLGLQAHQFLELLRGFLQVCAMTTSLLFKPFARDLIEGYVKKEARCADFP